MKYSLVTVTGIKSAAHDQELFVNIEGDDKSRHEFRIKVEGRDISSLTLSEIEKLAIEHARQSFANCN